MKTKKRIIVTLTMITLLMVSFYLQSCQDDDKDIDITEQEEVAMAEDGAMAEGTIDGELEVFDESIVEGSTNGRVADLCPIITTDTVAKKITLDFGTGCTSPHGYRRSGKVIITYSGTFGDNVANRIITFDQYTVNNKKLGGTVELRNFNRNAAGNLTAQRGLIDYSVTFPNGNTIVLNGSTTREWLEGASDDIEGNEVIRITGSYEGVSTRGRKFTRTIIEPIIADFKCKASIGFLHVAGILEMAITGAKTRTRTINYGTGTCDNEIVITINGKAHTLNLLN